MFIVIINRYIGALIALVFLWSGYKVAKEALGRIIGNPTEKDVAVDIKKIVKSYDGVLGVHDLVVHNYLIFKGEICHSNIQITDLNTVFLTYSIYATI